MRISIITPSYNSASTIERAIESVLCQEYQDVEHIIVDGGSTDGTIDILKKYDHLRWISEPDHGQVDAIQKGFSLSSGEIIGNLNSDDYYLPNAFESILPLFSNGEDFVVGKVKVISEHDQNTWINDPSVTLEKMLKHWEPDAFCVNPVGYFYRRKVQESIPFNIKNSDKHDLEFLLLAATQYTFKKINYLLGVFSHSMTTKTYQEQSLPSYWNPDNFNFIDPLIKSMPEDFQKRYSNERELGYQLRRKWAIQDSFRLNKSEELLKNGEIFFLPEDADDAFPSRCGFVEFDRPASKGDWIIPVLTMGKIASKSICHTLKSLPANVLPAQVYHIHQTGLKAINSSLPSMLPHKTQAAVGSALRHLFEKRENYLIWKFITGVRDPISAALSSAFENNIPPDQLEHKVIVFAKNIVSSYFNLHYKKVFGIDIYKHIFEPEKGFSIIKNNNLEVLLYRFEDLQKIFTKAIDEYLGIKDLSLKKINVSAEKEYGNQYKKAIDDLCIGKNILDEIYSSQFVKHFYTQDEIHTFYNKWASDKKTRKAKKWEGLIYDVGMHTGQDTEFYLKKGFKVVAIDANPSLVEVARKRFASQIANEQLIVLNLGIVEKPTKKKLNFYINEELSEWSSFIKEIATRNGAAYKCVKVSCATLSEIIREYGKPYYIKIDIEGYDHIALKSLLDSQKIPKFISVENGNMGMLNMLKKAGYNAFKYIQQNNIYELTLPDPPSEGFYVVHSFVFGSSGPFGEETPGNWKSYDQVRKDIAKVWDLDSGQKNKQHDDSIHGWFDLHAKLAE